MVLKKYNIKNKYYIKLMELNAKNLEKLMEQEGGKDVKYIKKNDNMDVNKLFNALENESNASIMKLNTKTIQKRKNDMLQKLGLDRVKLKLFNKKLKQYRLCQELYDLQYGYFIRWIPLRDPNNIYLTNGGTIVDILLENNESHILCRNFKNRFFRVRFDEIIVFQKISDQEKVILKVLDYLEK
tara:strand:- start:18362 stop:18913 length:552 start_codon:yes stop_codon:yes gene_type:complete